MKKYMIGFDIGGTKCAVNLADVSDGIKLLDKISFPTESPKGYEYTKKRLFEAAWEIMRRNHTGADRLLAVGVSCGGPLDSRKGIVLSPPHLPGWDAVPLTEHIEDEFGVPAFLQNDANACALVEWKLGAGSGTKNMIFCTMGTGFGAGIIAEDVLLRGANDMAGEIGHLRLDREGPVGFGKAGSVEGFCSGEGIGLQARMYTEEEMKKGRKPAWVADGIAIDGINAGIISQYAHKGDPDAVYIYERAGDRLGRALSILVDAFNPEMIVIGSIFVRCEKLLRPSMEKAMREEALSHALEACRVVPAKTGEQIGDLASIMAACYGMGIDAVSAGFPETEGAARHYNRLFERYPALAPLKGSVLDAFNILRRTYRSGGKLLVCGNGGSAADSDHIVGELMKGFYLSRPLKQPLMDRIGEAGARLQSALPAIALTHHTALSTAFLNDVEPSMVFAQQVLGYGRAGDTLLCLSTSGNSANVVNAARVARAAGMRIIALTGETGGRLAEVSDILLNVPGTVTADIQELHLPVYHTLCAMLEEEFFGDRTVGQI